MNLMYIFDPWTWHKVQKCVAPDEEEITIGCIMKKITEADCVVYTSCGSRHKIYDVVIEHIHSGHVVGRCYDKTFVDALVFAYAQFVVYQKERFGDD